MRKIKVTDVSGRYVYDEVGKRYKCIGNVNFSNGDDAYCSGSVCLGNVRRGFKPMLPLTQGAGFPLWYCAKESIWKLNSRLINPFFYQKDHTSLYFGEIVTDIKNLTKNLDVQSISNWDGQFFHDYLFPGLYNVGSTVDPTYGDVQAANKGTRLLTVFYDMPILQEGMLKASTKDHKITLKSCEPDLDLNGDIYYSDKDLNLLSYEIGGIPFQNYLYHSLYSDDPEDAGNVDISTKYEGDTVNTLILTSKETAVTFNIKEKITEEMAKCFAAFAQKDDSPIYPTLQERPLPEPKVLWFTVTDPDFQRIDDLAENGQYLQFSNIKLFNVTDSACTLSIQAVGIAYRWLKHVSPSGSVIDGKWVPNGTTVNEWVPIVVNGYFTFLADKDGCRLVHFSYDSEFLEHTVYEKYATSYDELDDSPISISDSENLTPRNIVPFKDGYIRTILLGARYDNFKNVCTSKAVVTDDGFVLKLTDSLIFDSKKEHICSSISGKELIKVGKTCNAGINNFGKFKILLVNEKAYLLKDDQLLKSTDLAIKDRVLLNVVLSYSPDVNKTLKEGL